jgi:hypothetical protein
MDRVHGREVCAAPPGYANCAAAMAIELRADDPDPAVPATILEMCCG